MSENELECRIVVHHHKIEPPADIHMPESSDYAFLIALIVETVSIQVLDIEVDRPRSLTPQLGFQGFYRIKDAVGEAFEDQHVLGNRGFLGRCTKAEGKDKRKQAEER